MTAPSPPVIQRRPGPYPPRWDPARAMARFGPPRPDRWGVLRQVTRAVDAVASRVRPAVGEPAAGPAVAVGPDVAVTVPQRAEPPELAPGPWDAPGSLTAAPPGLFTFAVHASSAGFRIGASVLDAAGLAAAIWRCPRWRGRPVLLVTQPSAPEDGAGSLLRQLATELGTPVYVSDRGVRFTFGRVFADRMFWCWRPSSPVAEPEAVGAVLPVPQPVPAVEIVPVLETVPAVEAVPVVPEVVPVVEAVPAVQEAPVIPEAADELRALVLPVLDVAGLDLAVRQVAVPSADAPPAEPVPEAVPVQVPETAPAGPVWHAVRPGARDADREALRTTLGWKFQAHSRVVARAASLHPGLRTATARPDGAVGLVAVVALLDGMNGRVNAALRGASMEDDVRLLARCAGAGLTQLPVVTGPLFGAAPPGADPARLYRPGDVVVEPAFTVVSARPGWDDAPRYAIWSTTARRLDQLGADVAMFAAGTRFAVLAVDPAPAGPPWVLLRELVGGRRSTVDPDAHSTVDERVTNKLRVAIETRKPGAAATQPWPIGRTGTGEQYRGTPEGEGP